MDIADIIFLIIALFFVIRGFFKGFVSEFMSMAALICGIASGIMLHPYVSPFLDNYIKSATWRPLVAFLILFIGTYIIVKIVEIFLHNIVDSIQLNSLDRTLGLVWGALEAAVIILLIVFLIYNFDFQAGITFLKKSQVAEYAKDFLKSLNLEHFKDLPVVRNMHV